MKRRDFVRMLLLSSPFLLGGCSHLQKSEFYQSMFGPTGDPKDDPSSASTEPAHTDIAETQTAPTPDLSHMSQQELSDLLLKGERAKSENFTLDFPDDIFFQGSQYVMLENLVRKFRGVQRHVGFGNFNLVGMDEFFRLAEKSSLEVTAAEKKFLEELFFFDADKYGFKGEKVLTKFTDVVDKNKAVKIAGSGHYLKKGHSMDLYNKVRKDIGPSLVLTSGMRAIAKQFHLFLEKGIESKGNMSKASRSLAPPGYSFHGRGDFDVGKVGYGLGNFTQDFATTDEYKRLLDLGYINIRYTQSNLLGVRFEPWHIKVEG